MAALSYGELVAGLQRAGHPTDHIAKHLSAAPVAAERVKMSAVSIADAAAIIDEAIASALAPLEQRIAALEKRGGHAQLPKPRVRVQGERDGKPVVRLLPTRRIA